MTERIGGRLADLKAAANRAQETFEAEKGKLYRPDGSKLFADDVHEEEMAKLRSERRRTLEPIRKEANELGRKAQADAELAKHSDPMEALTDEELSRANVRRAFAIDAAETLPMDALKGRLEAVLAGGDRGLIYAYWTAGQRRREAVRGKTGATTLDDVLGRMEAALVGDRREKAIVEARERMNEALDVERLASGPVYAPTYSVPVRR